MERLVLVLITLVHSMRTAHCAGLVDDFNIVSNGGALPAKWAVSGITFTAGRYCPNVTMGSDKALWSLDHLASTGATHVSLVVTNYQHSINTTQIFPLYNASQVPSEYGYYVHVTVSEEDLVRAIRHAKSRNLSVMLKPHVDPLTDNAPIGNTWRGQIGEYFGDQQWDEWFESYWSMLKRYATIARAEGVEILSMNCELISANNQTRRWRELVEETRKLVGKDVALTTSPNGHGHENWVEWYDVLDIIGVDWYDRINGTTLHEMVESWSPYLAHLEGISTKFGGKPLMMTEMGVCSGLNGCDRNKDATPASRQHQAMRYEALFLATAGKGDWFLGGFWWNWDSDPAVGWGEDANDSCLSPAWKPAESILRKYYRASQPVPILPEGMRESQCVCTT